MDVILKLCTHNIKITINKINNQQKGLIQNNFTISMPLLYFPTFKDPLNNNSLLSI